MRRHRSLLATLTAICLLQTPLCALACVEAEADAPAHAAHSGSADAPVRAVHPASAQASPCHGEAPAPSSEPSEPTQPGHDDCGCASALRALGPHAQHATSIQAAGYGLLLPYAGLRFTAVACPEPRIQAGGHLPPPDILRITSILIL